MTKLCSVVVIVLTSQLSGFAFVLDRVETAGQPALIHAPVHPAVNESCVSVRGGVLPSRYLWM